MSIPHQLPTSFLGALLLSCVPTALHAAPVPAPAQEAEHGTLEWYLPADVEYDAAFPKPADVLGWEVGAWHVRHDQLVAWYRTVAAASPRMVLETYGRTHEERPLLLAAVSSPANLARLDELRAARREAILSGAQTYDGPEVVWMGYSVHGNEPSGSNASLLFAYHLAAARGAEVERFLDETIVLIDPCLNPDGLSRFAHWANTHKGVNLVGDPAHREHREVWPGGRTNHYWFDLNRDWLLGTHPESRGRLERFHAWMPSVLTDFHEMGSDSTYFFQPGIPSRQNPLTPERNLTLTRAIAAFHARALDELGSLYYTEESFDDFYYGKGSTYPDLHGAVGILFEQASSRGHLQENSFGGIDFPFTIRNQFRTSLSTLRAADALRDELSAYGREFYRTAREEAASHAVAGYVFGAHEDPGRTQRLVELLGRHAIRVHRLGADLEAAADSEAFDSEHAYVVPTDQPQFRLVRALFETRTSWPDNTFYDVSTWTLPLSFNVPYRAIERAAWRRGLLGAVVEDATPAATLLPALGRPPVAWAFEWHHREAPALLAELLRAGVRARVATKRFSAATTAGLHAFDYGTIVVPTGIQDVETDTLTRLLAGGAGKGLAIHAIGSGLTPEGVDLGSGSLRALELPEPALLVGRRTSSYEAGEAWHALDQRVGLGLSMVERDSLGSLDLSRYTHLVLVNGASSGWSDEETERVRNWVRAGGVLIAQKSSAVWAAETLLRASEEEDGDDDEASAQDEAAEAEEEPLRYEDYEDLRALERVAGTIFEVRLDRTHPLAFGYVRDRLPVFRNSTAILPAGEDPFAIPFRYTEEPLVSGFASEANVADIAGSPAVRAERLGAGSVVCLVDNPNFRGVWYGTERLFSNALFFGGAIKRTGPLDSR